MKRVHFVSGFNAKLAAAACVVAGFSLAGCDEESFTVDVPNVEVQVPDITWPEQKNGIAYVLLSATSSTGEQLNGVKFKIDETEQAAICVPVAAGQDHKIRAEKEGYHTNEVSVTVPELPKDVVLNIPVNVVLTPVILDDYDVEGFVSMEEATKDKTDKDSLIVPEPANGFQPGDYTVELPVPTAEPFLTDEQKKAFMGKVDTYLDEKFPATRVDDPADVKTHVKDLFYARINAYGKVANLQINTYTFNLDKPAKSVKLEINTDYYFADLEIIVHHNNEEFGVTGKCTVAGLTEINAVATPIDNGHGGHGNDPNTGGGANGQQ